MRPADRPVVYRMYAGDTLLYIGSTVWIENRIKNHETLTFWYAQVTRTEVEPFPTEDAARAGETAAIAAEHPRWNVRGRSDDHPDGPATFLWEIAAKYPDNLRKPPTGSAAALDYHQKIAPAASGMDLHDSLVRQRCGRAGLVKYLEELETAGWISTNQAEVLQQYRSAA